MIDILINIRESIVAIDKDKLSNKLNEVFTLENDKEGHYQMVFYVHTDGIQTREAAKKSLIKHLVDEIILEVSK